VRPLEPSRSGVALLLALGLVQARAQTPADRGRLAFEVASVKPNPNDVPEAISLQPNGGIALREQLGFLLESDKASLPVTIIDRAERPSPD
jgi:hypothetical protein